MCACRRPLDRDPGRLLPSRTDRAKVWLHRAAALLMALHLAAALWYCLMLVCWLGLAAVLGARFAIPVVTTLGECGSCLS